MNHNVEILRWVDALDAIARTGAADLVQALESSSVSATRRKAIPFYRVRYDYGDTIAKNGMLETESLRMAPAQRPGVELELGYADIPLGLVLSKTVEVNSALLFDHNRAPEYVSATLIRKGELFGVFETLNGLLNVKAIAGPDSHFATWNVCSGAQSVKINFPWTKLGVEERSDWRAIKKISSNENKAWSCEVLFFSKSLLNDAVAKHHLLPFIYRTGWTQNQLLISYNEILDNGLSDLAALCRGNADKNVREILFWFFVRLLLVARGIRPGYVLVTENGLDDAGPFPSALTYLRGKSSDWTKRDNTPMIFQPCFLGDAKHGVYCSPFESCTVGRIGQVRRSVERKVALPVRIISRELHARKLLKTQGVLELRTKDATGKHLPSDQDHRYTRHGAGSYVYPCAVSSVESPFTAQFAKVLVHLIPTA